MKSSGSTPSERYLAGLCARSFLSPWSFPNVFRQPGQELCDLLVVFGNDVIIFSDKSCTFKDTGDVRLDWDRWHRRAIVRSEAQVHGAERWLAEYPTRVFVDPRCTQPLPIRLPPPESRRIHRIVVALGARDACKRFYEGGSGSLRLTTSMGLDLFAAGYVHPGRNYVHILDDVTLDIIMSELDTAPDFCRYLKKKEEFIRSMDVVIAAGEEDLLAVYLREVNAAGEHDFILPSRQNGVSYAEGFWSGRLQHPQYLAKKCEDEVSYAWDGLIEHFAQDPGFRAGDVAAQSYRERALRLMAGLSRVARRPMGRRFLEAYQYDAAPGQIVFKGGICGDRQEIGVIFLRIDILGHWTLDEYLSVRYRLLAAYAAAMKYEHPGLDQVIGVGLPPPRESGFGFALFYRDLSDWSDEDERAVLADRDRLGLLTRVRRTNFEEPEYPDAPTVNAPFIEPTVSDLPNRRQRRRLAAVARKRPPHIAV